MKSTQSIYEQLSSRNWTLQKIFSEESQRWRIKIKSKSLEQNLSIYFNNIYAYPPERGGLINGISLLGNDQTGERETFSIALYSKFMSKFTALCPQLVGCISQGNTRQEALVNLCVALAESTILNYEYLKINPFSTNTINPSFDLKQDDTTFSPYEMASYLYLDFGFDKVYLSDNNIIMKHTQYPKLTLVIPLVDLNLCTQMTLSMIAQKNIKGGSTMMNLFDI
jgi:hypothetical protein